MQSELSIPLSEVVTKSFDALVYMDRDFHIADLDLRTTDIFGYDRVELLGQPIDMLLPSVYRLNHQMLMQGFLEGQQQEGRVGKSFRMITGMRKSGEEFPCYGVIFKFTEPRQDEAVACILLKELSGIVRLQRSLEASERNFNHGQKLALIGSWEFFIHQDTLFWSDEVYRVFKVDPANYEPNNQDFLKLLHPDDLERVQALFDNSIHMRTPYNILYRVILSDGTTKLIQERGQTLFSESGEPQRSIGTVQDITDMLDLLPQLTEYSRLIK